jgi:cobalt-zinc-cadmium efflux system outer membrane protein
LPAAVPGTILALGLGVAFGRGASAGVLTLDDALARARAAGPSLQAAAAELDAARGRLTQARLPGANPVLTGELARHTAPGEEQLDRGVTLEQEVEVGGQWGLRIDAAMQGVARAEQMLADRSRLLAGEVRRAFFAAVASGRQRSLAAEGVALADRLTELARRRARAGDVGALDVRLAEIEGTRAAQAGGAAEATEAQELARLAALLGVPPEEPLAVTSNEVEPAPVGAEVELIGQALAVRPDLAAARLERARLETEAVLARRHGLVPNPVLRGFFRQELLNERIMGGEISIPLPVWNRQQGTEVELRAQARATATEVERLTAEIPRQVRLALLHRRTAGEAWARYRDTALPAARAVRDDVERAYAQGYLGLSEVLVQEDRLRQARAAAIDAWRELRVADAELMEAVGVGP